MLTTDGLTKNAKANAVVKEDNNNEKITGDQDNQTGASYRHLSIYLSVCIWLSVCLSGYLYINQSVW